MRAGVQRGDWICTTSGHDLESLDGNTPSPVCGPCRCHSQDHFSVKILALSQKEPKLRQSKDSCICYFSELHLLAALQKRKANKRCGPGLRREPEAHRNSILPQI